MTNPLAKIECLNGTVIKIIALVSMTLDHIGFILFPEIGILRILGRLAFPIFAYMIAEGCDYTKNKGRYLLLLFGIGIIMQGIQVSMTGLWYLNIMFTLGFAAVLIFLLQWAFGRRNIFHLPGETKDEGEGKLRGGRLAILILVLIVIIFICVGLKEIIPDFAVDYGIFGVLLPFVVYLPRTHLQKLIVTAIWLVFLSLTVNVAPWFCMFALIPLALYNGKRGKHSLKYLFYIYYPVHLGILWGIQYFFM